MSSQLNASFQTAAHAMPEGEEQGSLKLTGKREIAIPASLSA